MEKTTKKGVKKLLMSVMVMVIALVGAATSTYAWFTTTAAPRVDPFQVKVSTVSGLYIALDDSNGLADYWDLNYKSYITAPEIYSVINKHATDATLPGSRVLVPFSTTDILDFVDFNGDYALTGADEGKVDRVANPEYSVNDMAYFTFDLYFRGGSDYAGQDIALDFRTYGTGANAAKKTRVDDSGAVTSMNPEDVPQAWLNQDIPAPTNWTYANDILTTITTNRYGVAGTINLAANNRIQSNAANAVRLGFIGTSDLSDVSDTSNIWDPRSNSGYYGVGGNAVDNFALDLKNAFNDTEITIPTGYFTNHLNDTNLSKQVLVTLDTDNTVDIGIPVADTFNYGKLTVKIWIDGWDGDCLNAIMDDFGTINLQFKVGAEA